MHFLCFQAVFELISDSLTALQVVPNQCLSHQSILLTHGTILEILAVIAQLLGVVEKLSFFESAILNFFLLHSHQNQFTFMGQQGFLKILMIILVSIKFLVCLYFFNTVYPQKTLCAHVYIMDLISILFYEGFNYKLEKMSKIIANPKFRRYIVFGTSPLPLISKHNPL